MAADGDGYVSHPPPLAGAGKAAGAGGGVRLRAHREGRRGGVCPPAGVSAQGIPRGQACHHHRPGACGYLVHPPAGAAGQGRGPGIFAGGGVWLHFTGKTIWDPRRPQEPEPGRAAVRVLFHGVRQAAGPYPGVRGGGGKAGKALGRGRGEDATGGHPPRLHQVPHRPGAPGNLREVRRGAVPAGALHRQAAPRQERRGAGQVRLRT